MEFNKCSRCGNFYVSEGNVCPKCSAKDNFEFSTFKTYIEANGLEQSLETISGEIGITTKNLNRFLSYDGLKDYQNNLNNIDNQSQGNTGITFN